MDRRETGQIGEDLAVAHLCALGWQILDRNWRCASGELDIVARDLAGVVVFCEVKCRRGGGFGSPLEAITVTKMRKLRSLAVCWLRTQSVFTPQFRFDGIGVLLTDGAAPQLIHKEGIGL
ncbi:MAG: YraN family protein [Propionibacteriaceae bacterium]|nr:YraN family protein [Propionibacteriaceae bacterium]